MDERDIFERHAQQVLQYFVNKVGAPADAGDLAQETFIRCFQRLRRGDVVHPRAFLFGVANFVLREYWNARARDRQEDFDPGSCSVVEMGAAKTSVTSLMARQQGQRRMLDAMRRLRLDYQNVLELRYWHDLKYSEIAEILGENEKTVGVWIRRAKHDLRRILEQSPDPPLTGEPGPPGSSFTPQALEQWLRDSTDARIPTGGPDHGPPA
jgi:RNA polymerase sigma-70 factor (ECF subfamily)